MSSFEPRSQDIRTYYPNGDLPILCFMAETAVNFTVAGATYQVREELNSLAVCIFPTPAKLVVADSLITAWMREETGDETRFYTGEGLINWYGVYTVLPTTIIQDPNAELIARINAEALNPVINPTLTIALSAALIGDRSHCGQINRILKRISPNF
jgi:hypothetical protein